MSLSKNDKIFRKKLFLKINKIKDKKLYFQIYQILIDNKENFDVNFNGVFFDLYKLSLKSTTKIEKLLEFNDITTEETPTQQYSEYSETLNDKEKELDENNPLSKIISPSNITN